MSDGAIRRRLAAILAVDVVGYSRQMAEDEQGTLARIRALRTEVIEPLIVAHAGRLFAIMGDGFLVEFASTVQAVECALAIQSRIAEGSPRLSLRIGIHVGDVVVVGDGVTGDGVNIAVRLEGLAEPGGICISGRVREDLAGKLTLNLADLGTPLLKNIDRPIQVFRVRGANSDSALPVVINNPFLAVLPFQNLSGDPEQDYFVDGLVEDIITEMSRIPWLFVTARNSSFIYKGKAVDIRQVGRELGVQYVLEGSIRRAGKRVRIVCQLIDATTGGHLWVDRFEGDTGDVFDLQDRISESVAGAIEPNLQRAEIARATIKATDSLDAYDLYLRALPHFYAVAEDGTAAAVRLLRQALALDPHYSRAKALLGWAHVLRLSSGWAEARDADEAIQLAKEVFEAEPNDASLLRSVGQILGYVGPHLDLAREAVDRAMMLNPASGQVLLAAGWVYSSTGHANAAIDFFQRGIRLSPMDPTLSTMLTGLGMAYLQAGRDREAEETFRRAIAIKPHVVALRGLITVLIRTGRAEEATRMATEVLRLWPSFQVSAVRIPFSNDAFVLEQRSACQLAGLPE